ncbi:hypothetical protein E2C01_021684 [Portunus trituberculatus]|uniref:Uncharacterized protein n=1 Tax=Portunus trituberculatus TaxID=210409 RepID=A0A5B7E407_PORTR|nr:hypothetical protein [Portunus trituberculatus]
MLQARTNTVVNEPRFEKNNMECHISGRGQEDRHSLIVPFLSHARPHQTPLPADTIILLETPTLLIIYWVFFRYDLNDRQLLARCASATEHSGPCFFAFGSSFDQLMFCLKTAAPRQEHGT